MELSDVYQRLLKMQRDADKFIGLIVGLRIVNTLPQGVGRHHSFFYLRFDSEGFLVVNMDGFLVLAFEMLFDGSLKCVIRFTENHSEGNYTSPLLSFRKNRKYSWEELSKALRETRRAREVQFTKRKRVAHYCKNCFPKGSYPLAVCGFKHNIGSKSDVWNDPNMVTCKNCRKVMKNLK